MPMMPPTTRRAPTTMRKIRVPERPPSSGSSLGSGSDDSAGGVVGSADSVGSACTGVMVKFRLNSSPAPTWMDSSMSSKSSLVTFRVMSPGAMVSSEPSKENSPWSFVFVSWSVPSPSVRTTFASATGSVFEVMMPVILAADSGPAFPATVTLVFCSPELWPLPLIFSSPVLVSPSGRSASGAGATVNWIWTVWLGSTPSHWATPAPAR